MGRSDASTPSRRTSLPSLGGTTARPLAMQARRDASLPARNSSGPRTVPLGGDIEVLPGSWGVLVCMPCSSDPGEVRSTRSLWRADAAFRGFDTVGPRG